ncbi:indolepyruvate ferredoxin oxidoreductase [Amylibacter kogurei]|uniref:Indolepyruvate ferredoxin oxidoreductase n=1 Tax=Paramylibacter kogurei TaxID=1889778 RepID=A0A2G5K0N5_9RHOB|nr:indolepyruvate ferredoxin oxidoreductase family protein [Amylibacter kogurei]PIB23061.1 indolepyruvate ferredoxin oxidoreductase [Amylibacter kogurei]
MTKHSITLDDKFDLNQNRIFISGTQALVRLCLMQAQKDNLAGFNTAGYVTGYRGSPLGGLDQQFGRAKKHTDAANIVFEPGLNEDIAATAVWGTQQANLRGDGKYDGVFSMWYGKGPGVDRSGDVFRHANMAGTSPLGGALVIMGDDHTCESSTTAHQSDYALMDAMIPVFYPATVSEILEYGLHGWAMSRFAGVWCGIKCVKDNVESSGSVDVHPDRYKTIIPNDFDMPKDGLNIRLNDMPTAQEARMHQHKFDAVLAYQRANGLNHVTLNGGKKPKIGIVSTGKSYLDVLQALEELGIDETRAAALGLSVFKVAMPWPLEPTGIAKFCEGLDQVIVVEEKRGLIEGQLREQLYGQKNAPSIIGKKDENGAHLFQPEMALNPIQIAAAVGERLIAMPKGKSLANKVADLKARMEVSKIELPVARGVVFCAGCPHNSSTVLPEGARGYAGIGCHWMAQFMERNVEGYTHMGGEGANWIGESKFSKIDHVFQNLGDGTFNHSGLLALRAAVASNVNITYKILYNDAVAMTGGQTHEGGLSAYDIVREVMAAGVQHVEYVTEDPSRIDRTQLSNGITVHHRDDLMKVQESMTTLKGVSVLLYDQTCASEKRRRRKRGKMADDPHRIYINPDVCEGCGDCGEQSNCVAIQPLDTPLGRKRMIDQSVCNKDFSCTNGFCPSFVTVTGGAPRKNAVKNHDLPDLQEPVNKAALDKTYSILVTGVGGTGVVTIGALLGMAAHLDGKGSGIIDMAGLAQKGGSVFSHVKLAPSPEDIKSIRVSSGTADLLLGCDVIVSAGNPALSTLSKTSAALVNTHEQMPREFAQHRDFKLPRNLMHRRLLDAVGDENLTMLDASDYATKLVGDSIGANLFMLGVAYQKGLIPLELDSILDAIEINGMAVEMNKTAFTFGRQWVLDKSSVDALLPQVVAPKPETLDTIMADRFARLKDYQNEAYAQDYRGFMNDIIAIGASGDFAISVAKYLFKLMAYKDEYEVARLYSLPSFRQGLEQAFTGDLKLKIALAPPLLSRPDKVTGKAKKINFGPWVLTLFKVLAKGKSLRGTAYDPFGYTSERRMERGLIHTYKQSILDVLDQQVDPETALEIANIPDAIRGYGHVKLAAIQKAEKTRAELLARAKDTIDITKTAAQ